MSRSRHTEQTPTVTSHKNPIFIDDDGAKSNGKFINNIATISRLPAFQQTNQMTKLLYSKFIVKGVKPINQEAILHKLGKKSPERSQRKRTQTATNYTKEVIVRENQIVRPTSSHHRNTSQKDQVFDFSMEKCLHKKGKSQANLFKYEGDAGFQRSKTNNRPQSALPKSVSLKQLTRPQSSRTARPQSATRPVSASSRTQSKRPETALTRKSSQQILANRYQFTGGEKQSQLLTISQNSSNLRGKDFIEKNKIEVSSARKSIYLTATEIVNILGSKGAKKKEKEERIEEQFKFPKRQVVTARERLEITQKQRNYLHFMKENMPVQYQQCVQYLSKQDLPVEEPKSIFSQSFGQDEPVDLTARQVQQFEVQHFYQKFLNKCLNVEYAIKKTQPVKEQPQLTINILNYEEKQTILSLYHKLRELKQNDKPYQSINQKIKKLVKELIFFKELKSELLKTVFEMHYQIKEVEQNEIVIDKNSKVSYAFVILSGSVTKQNIKEDEDDDNLMDRLPPPKFITTLFDGQIFGLPNKVTETILNYQIKTVEKCVLMMFPYQKYKVALSSNQNIQDRIQLLKMIFPPNCGKYKFLPQDYQTIAYKMDTASYSAQQVIVRQGQCTNQLMMVAHGSVDICFESVVKRKKPNVDPLLKKRKDLKKQIHISELRRNNLINYQLLQQNARQMHYYRVESVESRVRGQAVNWKNFNKSILDKSSHDDENTTSLQYSIMSIQNDTRVYLLSYDKISQLSEHILENIASLAEKNAIKQKIHRNQADLNKWQQYKIKVCAEVLSKKQLY